MATQLCWQNLRQTLMKLIQRQTLQTTGKFETHLIFYRSEHLKLTCIMLKKLFARLSIYISPLQISLSLHNCLFPKIIHMFWLCQMSRLNAHCSPYSIVSAFKTQYNNKTFKNKDKGLFTFEKLVLLLIPLSQPNEAL